MGLIHRFTQVFINRMDTFFISFVLTIVTEWSHGLKSPLVK